MTSKNSPELLFSHALSLRVGFALGAILRSADFYCQSLGATSLLRTLDQPSAQQQPVPATHTPRHEPWLKACSPSLSNASAEAPCYTTTLRRTSLGPYHQSGERRYYMFHSNASSSFPLSMLITMSFQSYKLPQCTLFRHKKSLSNTSRSPI